MTQPLSTCWTLIHGAATGRAADRAAFARCYTPVVRAYLAARWRDTPRWQDLDDAVQEVFVACFEPAGLLRRADPTRPGGFRAYLYGLVRHVALRFEERATRDRARRDGAEADLDLVPDDGPDLARAFDRAWARALLREAAARQDERARQAGGASARRVELLRLRFHDGLPIREVARLWGEDAARLHHEYAQAREEFREALREVVAFHQPGPAAEVDRACAELVQLLG
jgi:RNA polymerase sigma-70 factor (ECF subfamily)